MPPPSKIALITGAGSGIGRNVAQTLHRDGWSVVLNGRRREPLEETAVGLERSLICIADVTKPGEVNAMFEETRKQFGRLDLLFNNAGISALGKPLDEIPYERWCAVVDVNLNGCFLCAQHAMRMMKAQDPRGGRIINNGSVSAYVPRPHSAPYTATKHAITGLTKSISLDGRPFNVACGQIDIGNVATEMTSKMPAGALQADGSVKPEPTFPLQHVGDAVLYMANLPLEANVQFLTVMATAMPFVGRG